MTMQRLPYIPPRLTNAAAESTVDASAAFNLLTCDPSSVVRPLGHNAPSTRVAVAEEPGARRMEKTAAQLAKECYAEALLGQADSSSATAPHSADHEQAHAQAQTVPAALASAVEEPISSLGAQQQQGQATARPESAYGGSSSSNACAGRTDASPAATQPAPGTSLHPDVASAAEAPIPAGCRELWPGDLVLARRGAAPELWSKARVVRVYSSQGTARADVQWLREDGMPDAAAHSQGLQVGVDTVWRGEG